MKPPKIDIIGIGVGEAPISQQTRQRIADADVVVGGRKHLASVPFFKGRTIPITNDMDVLVAEIHQCLERRQRIVVLATGDPLLFGIGNTLIAHFGHGAVTVHPGVSAVQVALSRLGRNAAGAVVLSRHGAHADDLSPVHHHATSVVLTSRACSPTFILKEFVARYPQTKQWQGHVCQCLGMGEERIRSGRLQQLALIPAFQVPNLVVIENPCPMSCRTFLNFGRPDAVYAHAGGLITHPEVRAVTLSKLRLEGAGTLWDIGAGSGSLGIEAARLNPHLTAYCIEKNAGRYAHIVANQQRHHVQNMVPVRGNAVEICPSLPTPDRVFIGGGGAALSDLLPLCYARLPEQAVMVINTVTIESFETARRFFKAAGKETETIALQVARPKKLGERHILKPDNPVTLIGIKK